jgi:hypothetical protein
MTNTFTLFDIPALKDAFKSSTLVHDRLADFLNSYTFEDVYETEDDSLVFAAGDPNQIEIEFFGFEHPLKRTGSIMYWENGKPVIIKL